MECFETSAAPLLGDVWRVPLARILWCGRALGSPECRRQRRLRARATFPVAARQSFAVPAPLLVATVSRTRKQKSVATIMTPPSRLDVPSSRATTHFQYPYFCISCCCCPATHPSSTLAIAKSPHLLGLGIPDSDPEPEPLIVLHKPL